VDESYAGQQVVGLDLHRRRTVMVRMTPAGEWLEAVRFASDPAVLAEQIAKGRPVAGGSRRGHLQLVLGGRCAR
jgi:hypothetical protein